MRNLEPVFYICTFSIGIQQKTGGRPKRDFAVGFFSITGGEIFGCNFFRLQPIPFLYVQSDVTIYYDGIPVISVSYMAAKPPMRKQRHAPDPPA